LPCFSSTATNVARQKESSVATREFARSNDLPAFNTPTYPFFVKPNGIMSACGLLWNLLPEQVPYSYQIHEQRGEWCRFDANPKDNIPGRRFNGWLNVHTGAYYEISEGAS
jgi:hypothetical protein